MKIDKSTYDLCRGCRKETLAKVIGEFGSIPVTKMGLHDRILAAEVGVVFADYEKSVDEHQELIKQVTPSMHKRVKNRRPTDNDKKIVTRLGRLAKNIESCKKRLDSIMKKEVAV